jgi:eukaryotic-like serine/threonine-protein kinase
MVQRDSGNLAESQQSLRRALAIQQQLADSNPALTRFRRDLANSHNELGDVLRATGKMPEARASYTSSCEILEPLIKVNPSVPDYPFLRMQALRGLGATQHAAGGVADAVATWRQAIAIGERLHPLTGEALSYLAGCHALLGGIAGTTGSGLSTFEGTAELDRAIDSLRRAVAAGYHPVGWLEHDQDLTPVRSRPDFQSLMLDLSFPAEPFGR